MDKVRAKFVCQAIGPNSMNAESCSIHLIADNKESVVFLVHFCVNENVFISKLFEEGKSYILTIEESK